MEFFLDKVLQILLSGLHWKIARQTLSEAQSLSSHLSGINLDQIPDKTLGEPGLQVT